MRRAWPGLLVALAIGCGSDDPASESGFAGEYRVIEVRQDDTCGGEGVVIDTDPALAWFDLADADGGVEWRTCSGESECEGTGAPVGDYPRRFDEPTGEEAWRGWLEASGDTGTVCNYFFYEITLERFPTELMPGQLALAERELRETRTMESCTRPAEVTVDSASCLSQRLFLAIPR
ncbi:MAG TPA: hypothetical protein VIG06_12620 [Kofleriaceae bacterium]